MATLASMNSIQTLYVAYYGRAADKNGLEYWAQRLDDSEGDISQIVNAFGVSDEFSSRFNNLSDEVLINNIYQQAFNRDADTVGLEFYVNALSSGAATLATIAINILDGAQGVDLVTLENKQEVASLLTDTVAESISYYKGNGAADASAELLAKVTADEQTVIQQKIAVAGFSQGLVTDPDQFIPVNLEEGYQTRYEFDENIDGKLDAVKNYTHNDEGEAIRAELDSNVDGVVDEIIEFEYNESGYLTTLNVDSDADGEVDSITSYEYQTIEVDNLLDDNSSYSSWSRYPWTEESPGFEPVYDDAKVTLITVDNDLDGLADAIERFSYTDQGDQTLHEKDTDADGVAEYYRVREYDAQGNETYHERDSDGDGVAEWVTSSNYGQNGNKIYYEVDNNSDGLSDFSYRFEYDARGYKTLFEQDYDGDGVTDTVERFYYDSEDNLISEERDGNADGVADYTMSYTYDDVGNKTSTHEDRNGDSQDEVVTTTQYDSNGNVVYYSMDNNGDGEVDWSREYEYNDEGQVVVQVSTQYNVDYIYYEYDDQGRETRKTYDNAHGDDDVFTREYDTWGNLIEYIRDKGLDGEYEEHTVALYDGDGQLMQRSIQDTWGGQTSYSREERYDNSGNLIFVGVSDMEDMVVY